MEFSCLAFCFVCRPAKCKAQVLNWAEKRRNAMAAPAAAEGAASTHEEAEPAPGIPLIWGDPTGNFPLPPSLCLCRYDGGYGMCQTRQLLNATLPSSHAPETLKKKVLAHTADALYKHLSLRDADRVAVLPAPALGSRKCSPKAICACLKQLTWNWTVGLQVSSYAYGAPDNKLNVMAHGVLHKELVQSTAGGRAPTRLGCSKWPLIGMYDAQGFVPWSVHMRDGDPIGPAADVPEGALAPSDQHVHWVGEGSWGEWHFGGDTSRCAVQPAVGSPFSMAWFVAVDLGEGSGDGPQAPPPPLPSTVNAYATLILACPGQHEGRLDRILTKAADEQGLHVAKLMAEVQASPLASELKPLLGVLQGALAPPARPAQE